MAPLLLASVLAASCGTPEKSNSNAPLYKQAKQAHVPTSVVVSIAQMKFHPDTVNIQRGDTVVFTNQDLVDHNATALPDSAWASPNLHTGDSWSVVPVQSTDYFCSIHVVMRGRINVSQPPS